MKDLVFGQEIVVRAKLCRCYESCGRKEWKPSVFIRDKPVLFIGKRTLSNGVVDRSYEEGATYEAKEWLNVILVVENERTKPYYVRHKDIV